jgi:DNA ligase-1
MDSLPKNFNPIGSRASEKLDGIHAHYDGQKLVSRSGNTINVPQWFLDKLERPAKGELFCGRNTFQLLQSIVCRNIPDDRWQQVRFIPFDEMRQTVIESADHLKTLYETVLAMDGEGLVITTPEGSQYKLKPISDDDGRLIEHIPGNGKYAGLINGFRLQLRSGNTIKVSAGMTDDMRADPPAIGSIICFQFNGLTKKGLPRHARIKGIRAETNLNF